MSDGPQRNQVKHVAEQAENFGHRYTWGCTPSLLVGLAHGNRIAAELLWRLVAVPMILDGNAGGRRTE